jgi:hypothetical protein
MTGSTLEIIRAALKADQSVPPAERVRIIASLKHGQFGLNGHTESPPKLVSRKEAATRLGGKSARYVDKLARQGLLMKITLPNRKRASGVSEASLNALIQSNPQNS